MPEKISPGVVIDGQTYYPPGWMYVMAFAFRGCQWAIDEVMKGDVDRAAKAYWAEREVEASRPWVGDGI